MDPKSEDALINHLGNVFRVYEDETPIASSYDAGFLTIRGYDEETGLYTLGIPNEEVSANLIKIAANYSSKDNNIDSWKIKVQSFPANCIAINSVLRPKNIWLLFSAIH